MTPVKKRPRLETDQDEETTEVSSDPKEELRLHEEAISQFLNDLDAIESCADKTSAGALVAKASCTLLNLRSLQRQLLHTMEQKQERVMLKRQEVERQELALQNLKYERKYLERQCQECKDYHTPQLEQMSRDETENSSVMSADQVMNLFLCDSVDISHDDPAQQQTIMTKLHKELNARGSLERDLSKAQKELAEKKRAFSQKQQFLKDLPKKLRDMEMASLPLQKFFHKSNVLASSSTVNLIGTERKKLFDSARELPGPLYTLFVQLQSYMDAFSEKELTVEIAQESGKQAAVRQVDNELEEWCRSANSSVLLHMPIPDVKETTSTSRTPKKLTVCFEYYDKLHLVTARAYGCEDRVDVSTLLVELFPGDSGTVILNGSNLMMQEAPTPNRLLEKLSGRPYHWCNFIAGLQFPKAQSTQAPVEQNTKAVLDVLDKRLRANTTLQYLLHTLEKRKPNPIPVHPSTAAAFAERTCDAKLVGWTQKAVENDECKKSFLAIVRRKACTLRATVTLDVTRYPVVPPVWSLTGAEESWGEKQGSATALEDGSNPLYDATLGELEDSVNDGLESMVVEGLEETYEWILVHQLRKLVEQWDAMQRTQEGSESR